MPLFEYACHACEGAFERLTRNINADADNVVCPGCGSSDVHKVISMFGVSGGESSGGMPFPGGGGGHTHNGIT